MSEQANIMQYDRGEIFDRVADLFQDKTEWHGWRTRTEIGERFEKGEVSWIHRGGNIVCAATYRHRQTSHTRVYFTAMRDDNWHPRSWEQMITGILLESPHDRIISKTPVDSREADLWENVGMRLRREDDLYVWEVLDRHEPILENW